MLNIRTSEYLGENYNELSEFCHSRMEPVFITKDGQEDLAVLSVEAYKKFISRYELYNLLEEGLEAERNGDVRDLNEFMDELRMDIKNDCV